MVDNCLVINNLILFLDAQYDFVVNYHYKLLNQPVIKKLLKCLQMNCCRNTTVIATIHTFSRIINSQVNVEFRSAIFVFHPVLHLCSSSADMLPGTILVLFLLYALHVFMISKLHNVNYLIIIMIMTILDNFFTKSHRIVTCSHLR